MIMKWTSDFTVKKCNDNIHSPIMIMILKSSYNENIYQYKVEVTVRDPYINSQNMKH